MSLIVKLVDKFLVYLNQQYVFIYPEVIPSNFTYKNLFRFDKKSNLKKYLDEIKYTFN